MCVTLSPQEQLFLIKYLTPLNSKSEGVKEASMHYLYQSSFKGQGGVLEPRWEVGFSLDWSQHRNNYSHLCICVNSGKKPQCLEKTQMQTPHRKTSAGPGFEPGTFLLWCGSANNRTVKKKSHLMLNWPFDLRDDMMRNNSTQHTKFKLCYQKIQI